MPQEAGPARPIVEQLSEEEHSRRAMERAMAMAAAGRRAREEEAAARAAELEKEK